VKLPRWLFLHLATGVAAASILFWAQRMVAGRENN
jgi:hypothetical protein